MIRIPPYPDLPVVARREDFLTLIRKHSVVIVQADTGSGKSTQLPKFLLEAGFAEKGRIGVTQPRRIAALSIADRLREELEDESLVSARIRFLEEGNAQAPIKVMTDGILLQEFRKDRLLRQYSCILLDEAHERSLNIDILLGIFRDVVERRPEFRLVVASATLDAELFKEFYPGSAVLSAEGRLFPVEVEFRPPQVKGESRSKGDSGLLTEAADAILDLLYSHPDNLLCFLPTERDIQDLTDDLKGRLDEKRYDILPLFGRLSPQEQKRVFHSSSRIKVVLATNIAETSLTIPGIAYVVDTGLARVSRYNAQARIQGLPVEEISQASARQRLGRAGRVKPGRCIRLYSEKDLLDRPEYTEPEIRRSNLANVVLQLKSLHLHLEEFPFIQAPARQAFRGACRQLHELGALESPDLNARVTRLGHNMAHLPMDVALSAVLLRAQEMGCLQSAVIIASALCIQDPRITPMDGGDKEKARASHRRFGGAKSDFLAMLNLWNHVHKHWEQGSLSKLRRLCEEQWLHFLRMREWMDLYEQFCRILKVDYLSRQCPQESFHRDTLHMALLSGFLGGIARRDIENACYRLVGGRESHLFPGSDLYGKNPEWVVAAEVRETSRVFLSRGAEIKPDWILKVAGDFCTRRWYDPVWNPQRGFVEAVEEVQFRSMVISRGKRVDYGRIDPQDCANIFWREAVVEGNMPRPFAFMEHNAKLIEFLRGKEAKLRRWGLAPGEDQLVAWYKEHAPGVYSLPALKDFLHSKGEGVLKQSAHDWEHLEQTALAASAMKPVRSTGKLGDVLGKALSVKAQNHSTESQEKMGAREIFEISGIKVQGELIFDSKHPRDGLTLELPADLWRKTTPASLAVQVTQWRQWMLETVLRELPESARTRIEKESDFFDDRWVDRLEKDPFMAPMQALLQEVRALSGLESYSINFSVAREAHLLLHLRLASNSPNDIALELSPEMNHSQYFLQSIAYSPLQGLWNLSDGLCWGWRLVQGKADFCGEFAFQEADLAHWWSDWQNKLAPASNLQGPVADLLSDRLKLLHGLGGDSLGHLWCLRRLIKDCEGFTPAQVEQKFVRFSGIEGLQGKRLADFKALGKSADDQASHVRRTLSQMTLAAAFFGAEAMASLWKHLESCVRSIRRAEPLQAEWIQWSEWFDNSALENQLALVAAVLHLDSEGPWPEQGSQVGDWISERESFALRQRRLWRNWRETGRPWLSSTRLSVDQKNALRNALRLFEGAQTPLQEGVRLGLEWQGRIAEWEQAQLRRAPISVEENEDTVTVSDLQRLKDRFKKN